MYISAVIINITKNKKNKKLRNKLSKMLKSKQQIFYEENVDEEEAFNYDHTPMDMMNSDFFNDDIYDYKEEFLNGKRSREMGDGVGDLAEEEDVYDDQNDIEFAHMADEFDEQSPVGHETFFKRVDSMEFVRQKQPKVIDKYLMGELLGDGSYGKVKECLDMDSLARRAVKIINLKMVSRKIPKGVENVRKEIKIMKKLVHKNTIKLYSTFEKGSLSGNQRKKEDDAQDPLLKSTTQMINLEKPPKLYIFMDYCITSLEKLLKTAPLKRFTNFQANYYFRQLIDGLEYLHSLNIIHNDIKPGNLLVTCDDVLKICDFSISADLGLFCEEEYATMLKEKANEDEMDEMKNSDEINPNLLSSSGTGKFPIQQCTPMFQCPEMLDENIDELFILRNATKIDIWSSGITLYQLTTGTLPFQGQTLHQIFEMIRSDCEIKLPSVCDRNLSVLLRGMLDKDMVKRWSIDEIRESEWFRKKHALIVEEMAPLPRDVQENELGSCRMIDYLQNYCQTAHSATANNFGSEKFYSTEEEIASHQPVNNDPEQVKTNVNQATKLKKTNCLIM